MKKPKPVSENNERISNSTLADFLSDLSRLYVSREFGNPALAQALRELARSLRRGALDSHRKRLPVKASVTRTAAELERLRRLDPRSVERFISDETKSKMELVDLAAIRFSIPTSQLKRMKLADVREVIKSALLHENSIEILAEESTREGSARLS
jgi:hypothetical protein